MIKDLTTLKWRKYIYYTSDETIFDIESKKKKFDIDACGTYLIDIENGDEKLKKAGDGTPHDISKTPEIFVDIVPYIEIDFVTDSDRHLKRQFPLQFLIEEGDKLIDGKVVQTHPDVFDGKYVNKFNQEIFRFIKEIVKNKEIFNSKNAEYVLSMLPDWLTLSREDDKYMSEDYIDKYFLRGFHYNQSLATKPGKELYIFNKVTIDSCPINIWNKQLINEALKAIYAERIVNKYYKEVSLSSTSMQNIAESIKNVEYKVNPDSLATFLNIVYDDGVDVRFESLCVSKDVDTYYEYLKFKEEEKQRIRSYFTLVKDEESWNESMQKGGGLYKYYQWSDQANAPYKEDLWNTVANRAANINDARKDPETNELVLDENGNYIYDNCERCWQGAIKAPGAKYPWIVVNITDDTPSYVIFKYTYPDGTVKEVRPWGSRIFGGPKETRREWGCASIATEFEDNSFLLPENGNSQESTFDIERFELVLEPVQ